MPRPCTPAKVGIRTVRRGGLPHCHSLSRMIDVRRAEVMDVSQFVDLQIALFEQDAGIYGSFADLSWPVRQGAADFETLMASASSIVLIAESDEEAIGFLVGYVSEPTPTRAPVNFAILRSLFVAEAQRGQGAGGALCTRFVDWARDVGCVEAHVDAYAANEGAQRFYERHGFAARSISRARSL